jgi:signal transduction histidine kinase
MLAPPHVAYRARMGSSHPPAGGGERRWPPARHRDHHVAKLAVLIALVQTVGTTLTARGQPVELEPLGYALLAASGLALIARRRFPAAAVAAAAAPTVAYHVLDYPQGPTFVALIIAAVVAVKAGHRYEVWAIAGAAYVPWVVLTGAGLNEALRLAAWGAGVLLLSEWVRVAALHRSRVAQVRQEQLRVRDEQQRRQAIQERLRIAQELRPPTAAADDPGGAR